MKKLERWASVSVLGLLAAAASCSTNDSGDSGSTSGPSGATTGATSGGATTGGTAGRDGGGATTGGAGGATTAGAGGATGGTTTTTTSSGAAGATSGAGGATGTGGAGGGTGGAGGSGGGGLGCTDPTPPAGNRCAGAGKTTAAGGELLIDNLEPAAGDTATCHHIREVDGRKGSWNSGKDPSSPNGSVVHSFEAPGSGAAAGSTRAVRIVGTGLNGWGGYLAVPLSPCYNAAKYEGISFWFKGDPAKAPWMKVTIATPATVADAEGGACVAQGTGAGKECYDSFSVHLFKVSNVWTRYAITWQQLAQFGWGIPVANGYRPESEIIGINFSPDWGTDAANKAMNKGFEFWIDDFSFDVKGPFSDTGIKSIISADKFNGAFPGRAAFYSNAYDDLVAALDDPRFSRIGREGSVDDRKREIAALLAHVWWETGGVDGGFRFAEEQPNNNADYPAYCRANDPFYMCVSGQNYFGRGPLQLTWNYNYGQAGEYLGLGSSLLSNPGQIAQNSPLSWRAAMFFWMAWKNKDKNALLVGPHFRFLQDGFGGSMRAINGALDCGTDKAVKRQNKYKELCGAGYINVTGCDQMLACPAQ